MQAPGNPSATIFVADLSAEGLEDVPGLRVNGRRAVRASFPNRDPELSIFPDGWISDTTMWSAPIPPKTNESYVTVQVRIQ